MHLPHWRNGQRARLLIWRLRVRVSHEVSRLFISCEMPARTACCRADSSPFEPRGSLLMSAQPSRRKCRTLRARLLAQCQSGVVDGNALACHGVNFPRSRFGLVLSFRHEPRERRCRKFCSIASSTPHRTHGVRNGDLNANCALGQLHMQICRLPASFL